MGDAADMARRLLPSSYDFQIDSSVRFIERVGTPKRVALQLPEGLLLYATSIAEILAQFSGIEVLIMGDVAYGGCCVDDLTARALECGALIHYGHSALVPSTLNSIPVLYVPVDINLPEAKEQLQQVVKANFGPQERLALVSTVQFRSLIADTALALATHFDHPPTCPRASPLNPGETLGCTAPPHSEADIIISVGDGRFHMESVLMSGSKTKSFRFDPYTRELSREYFDHGRLANRRSETMSQASRALAAGGHVGVVFGSLGRQGNPAILKRLETQLKSANVPFIVVMLAEVDVEVLESFRDVAVWVEIACPRLAIDWGADFATPLITPYEAFSLLSLIGQSPAGSATTVDAETYAHPMDNYSELGGPWGNYYKGAQHEE